MPGSSRAGDVAAATVRAVIAGEQLGTDRSRSQRTTAVLSVAVAALLVLGIVCIATHTSEPSVIKVSVGAAGDRLREATSYRIRTVIEVHGENPAPALVHNLSMSTVVDVRNGLVASELDEPSGHKSLRVGKQILYVSVPSAQQPG